MHLTPLHVIKCRLRSNLGDRHYCLSYQTYVTTVCYSSRSNNCLTLFLLYREIRYKCAVIFLHLKPIHLIKNRLRRFLGDSIAFRIRDLIWRSKRRRGYLLFSFEYHKYFQFLDLNRFIDSVFKTTVIILI